MNINSISITLDTFYHERILPALKYRRCDWSRVDKSRNSKNSKLSCTMQGTVNRPTCALLNVCDHLK